MADCLPSLIFDELFEFYGGLDEASAHHEAQRPVELGQVNESGLAHLKVKLSSTPITPE